MTQIKQLKKVEDLRNKEVSNIIFGDSIRRCNNKKSGNHDITDFFIMPVQVNMFNNY